MPVVKKATDKQLDFLRSLIAEQADSDQGAAKAIDAVSQEHGVKQISDLPRKTASRLITQMLDEKKSREHPVRRGSSDVEPDSQEWWDHWDDPKAVGRPDGQPMVTDKQYALMMDLIGERHGHHEEMAEDLAAMADSHHVPDLRKISKREASRIIDHHLKLKREKDPSWGSVPSGYTAREPGDGGDATDVSEGEDLEVGAYKVGDTVYRVYPAQDDKTRLLSKKWTGSEWVYAGMASRFVKTKDRMSLEEAKEFGAATGMCCVCARTLTDPESVEAGIGPVCAKRQGG